VQPAVWYCICIQTITSRDWSFRETQMTEDALPRSATQNTPKILSRDCKAAFLEKYPPGCDDVIQGSDVIQHDVWGKPFNTQFFRHVRSSPQPVTFSACVLIGIFTEPNLLTLTQEHAPCGATRHCFKGVISEWVDWYGAISSWCYIGWAWVAQWLQS
jgi:hypothetical protein